MSKIQWEKLGKGSYNEVAVAKKGGHSLVGDSKYSGPWVYRKQLPRTVETVYVIPKQSCQEDSKSGQVDFQLTVNSRQEVRHLKPQQVAVLKQAFREHGLAWPPTEDISLQSLSLSNVRLYNTIVCIIDNHVDTDSVSRCLRLFKAINGKHYPAGEYKDGWVAAYFPREADNDDDAEIALKILDIYRKTRRIVVDGTDPRNFKKNSQNQLVLVDPALALSLRRGSVVSDDYWRRTLNKYPGYWSECSRNWGTTKAIQMVGVLLYLDYELKPGEVKDEYLNADILSGFTSEFQANAQNRLTTNFLDLLVRIIKSIPSFDFKSNMQVVYDNQTLFQKLSTQPVDGEELQGVDEFKCFEIAGSVILFEPEKFRNTKQVVSAVFLKNYRGLTQEECEEIFSRPGLQQLICDVDWIDAKEDKHRISAPQTSLPEPVQIIFNLWEGDFFPVPAEIYRKIFISPSLRNAFQQAFAYLESNQFGFFSVHGRTGKSQADTFIRRLLLSDGSEAQVRQEMQNWIKGYGWAGGSSLKLGSRTHFAYDSGIFGYSASRQSWAELSEAEKEHARELMLKKS